jgi:beta-galactosidase
MDRHNGTMQLRMIRANRFRPFVLVCAAVYLSAFFGAGQAAPGDRERPLNSNWKFLRDVAADAAQPGFDDSAWRRVDLPHDWSIEDLPAREHDPLFATVTLVPGSWKFSADDNRAFTAPDFDDSVWQLVNLPEAREKHSPTSETNGVIWYRRHFAVPPSAGGKTVFIDLGVIDGQDFIYIDGDMAQETGGDYWSNGAVMDRVVQLTATQAQAGDHVVAVKIKGPPTCGFTEAVSPPAGPSPCDPGRSAGNIFTGYAAGGAAWYRRHFTLPASDAGKIVRVVFDGSYMDTEVWINGAPVGRNVYGYSPFGLDLTAHLNPAGKENVLAVEVFNMGKNSRWYSGSGLYRPVHLEITNPLRVAPWGLKVATPEIRPDDAAVNVQIELLNNGPPTDAVVGVKVLDPRGKLVASSRTKCSVPGAAATAELTLAVLKPRLWSPASPVLYRAEVTVDSGSNTVDSTGTTFGIRSLSWDSARGFQLNGEPIKLRGGCVHHDHGPLGSASFPAAEERRVRTLKAAGFTAIRCSHNMPSTAFLEACDRAGMMVVDEAFDMWERGKNPDDYSLYFKKTWRRDLDAMLLRDRNHPCVVMWSIGNEIPERYEPAGAATARMLADHIRSLDTTRPVTAAFNHPDQKGDAFLSALDICGYNYEPGAFEPDHVRLTNRVMMTTESYPNDAFNYWEPVTRFPWVVGDFVWTAWDYRGESAIGHTVPENGRSSYLLGWPYANAFCGDFDVCGFVKPQGLYRQVLWDARRVAILVEDLPPGEHSRPDLWGWRDEQPSWTWSGWEGKPRVVRVYAKGDQARLLLNGNEIATQLFDKQLTATFIVPYTRGKLSAEVLEGGKVIAREQLATADPPAALQLTVENPTIPAGDQSIAFIDVAAVDEHGHLAPLAENRVRVSLEGVGTLAAFGNGDPRNVNSVQQNTQSLWRGRALLVVRSNGNRGHIKIQAQADGLKSDHAAVKVR